MKSSWISRCKFLSRAGKLSGSEESLFSGEYWTGRHALNLGLVDAIGDLRSVLRARFGDKIYMPLITPERGFFGRRAFGIGPNPLMGTGLHAAPLGLAEDMISALEARALWARYGL